MTSTQSLPAPEHQPGTLEWDGAPSEIQHAGPAFIARTYLIDKAFRRLRPQRLLDVGCGRGHVTAIAARHAKHVVATDLSEGAVRATQALLSDHGDARAYVADVLRGEWGLCENERAEKFDAVMLSEVLEHIDDDIKALLACRDLISEGGHLVLTVPGDPGLWTHWDDLAGHVRRYRRVELITKLESSGFQVESITNWGFPLNGWLSFRGARMRSHRVEERGRDEEVPSLMKSLLPAASVFFKLAARIEPLLSFLDRGAGYVVVAQRASRPKQA